MSHNSIQLAKECGQSRFLWSKSWQFLICRKACTLRPVLCGWRWASVEQIKLNYLFVSLLHASATFKGKSHLGHPSMAPPTDGWPRAHLGLTDRRPRAHRRASSGPPTGHLGLTDRRPRAHRRVTSGPPMGDLGPTDGSPRAHRQATSGSPTGHLGPTDGRPRAHRRVTSGPLSYNTTKLSIYINQSCHPFVYVLVEFCRGQTFENHHKRKAVSRKGHHSGRQLPVNYWADIPCASGIIPWKSHSYS